MRLTSQSRWLCALIGIAVPLSLYSIPAPATESGGRGVTTPFCKRCTVTSEQRTRRDTASSGGYDIRGGDAALVGSSVAKQAHHGHFQVNGAVWTYSPGKGFVGKDVMTVEWDLIFHEQAYVVFSEIHMTVE